MTSKLALRPEHAERLDAIWPIESGVKSLDGSLGVGHKNIARVLFFVGLWLAIPWLSVTQIAPWLQDQAAAHMPRHWEEPLGDAILAQLHKRGYVTSPNQTDSLGVSDEFKRSVEVEVQRLARAAGVPPIKVCWLEQNTANAMAFPGGHVCFTHGLALTLGHRKDLVVAVAAHEVAHVQQRDGLRAMVNGLVWGLILSQIFSDPSESRVADLAAEYLLHRPHSRDVEAATDLRGLELLHAIGYDPELTADLWIPNKNLNRESGNDRRAWLSTHPSHADREAHARAAAVALKARAASSALQSPK